MRFLQDFTNINIVRTPTLDSKAFKEWKFFKTFEEPNTFSFFCNPSRNMYPSLVKMFSSNLYFIDEIVLSEVKRHKTSLSLEEFVNILNLPHEDIVLNTEGKGYKFNHKNVSSSLMNNTFALYTKFINCWVHSPWYSYDPLYDQSHTFSMKEQLWPRNSIWCWISMGDR